MLSKSPYRSASPLILAINHCSSLTRCLLLKEFRTLHYTYLSNYSTHLLPEPKNAPFQVISQKVGSLESIHWDEMNFLRKTRNIVNLTRIAPFMVPGVDRKEKPQI